MPSSPASPSPEREPNILVIDDEAAVAKWIAAILEMHGCRTQVATTSDEGLHAFRTAPLAPDLIVMDYRLPGMPGTDLARLIWESAPDIPVLLVSGCGPAALDTPPNRTMSLLPKPFGGDEFLDAVGRLLRRGLRG